MTDFFVIFLTSLFLTFVVVVVQHVAADLLK